MPLNLDAAGLQPVTVQNQVAPCDGAKAIRVLLNFANLVAPEDTFRLDYSNVQAQGRFSLLQGIFIDNASNGSALFIVIQGTSQRIVCPAASQGYFPVLCQNPIVFTAQSAGGVNVEIQLLNFPVAPAVWHI